MPMRLVQALLSPAVQAAAPTAAVQAAAAVWFSAAGEAAQTAKA